MEKINEILNTIITEPYKSIVAKIEAGEPLSADDGLQLYNCPDLGLLSTLATYVKRKHSGNTVFYNKNFHIEPSNICAYNCRFCSYACHIGDAESWEYSIEDMVQQARKYADSNVTEVHVVGSCHPEKDLYYYVELLKRLRQTLKPSVHLKAFSAVEIEYMCQKSNVSIADGLSMLKEAGLQSIPGGGAEIFADKVRKVICNDKTTAEAWLNIHKTVHSLGLPSNATMLYGHIESHENRIDHLLQIRDLQEQTHGFNAFIPLKYRIANNELGAQVGSEVSSVEDMKNYAVCRLMLHNVPHLKAYWPMLGRQMAQMALKYGADDMDGTIDDSTNIYSMAGAEEQRPSMSSTELEKLIRQAGFEPKERDSYYKTIE